MAPRPSIAPMIVAKDIEKTYDYFTNVLGFAGLGKFQGPDGNVMHASVVLPTRTGEATIMFSPWNFVVNNPDMSGEFATNLNKGVLGNGVVLFLNIPDVDKYHGFISSKGAIIDEPPTDQFWGDRTISVLTPDGYYLTFASPIKGFKAPEGMGPEAGTDKVKATAPGTSKNFKIPGLKAVKAKAKKSKR